MEERILNFNLAKSTEMTLEELSKTYCENYPNGEPVGGIYHYVLFQKLMEMMADAGMDPESPTITAADNRDKYRPGVTIYKEMEEKYGVGSFESHALRRVYGVIHCKKYSDEDNDYGCAVSYHQKGIAIGFGPEVRVCSNFCILGARYYIHTNAIGGMKGEQENQKSMTDMLNAAKEILRDLPESVKNWQKQIKVLRKTQLTIDECRYVFARMNEERIMFDCTNKDVHTSIIYPLNDAMIKLAHERFLIDTKQNARTEVNAWDFYNTLNVDLKPNKVDMPILLPQVVRLNEFLYKEIKYLKK